MSKLSHMHGVAFWNIGAIFAGIAMGLALGHVPAAVGVISWIPVTLIKAMATPLLFLAILHGLLSDQISGSGVRRLLVICSFNAVAAILIATTLVNVWHPGESLQSLVASAMNTPTDSMANPVTNSMTSPMKQTTWMDALKGFVPDSIIGPFVQNNIPAVLILSLLIGVAVRSAGSSQHGYEPWLMQFRIAVERGLDVITVVMSLVLRLMPLAIFASVAKAVSDHGISVFQGLLSYVAVCVGGMLLQILIIYQGWIKFRVKMPLMRFWNKAKVPMSHAFGVNSSLAALPTTLNALDELGCPPGSSRLGACVGTNLNNDGILLYEVAALLMLGQAAGFTWSLGHQLGLAGVCVLATLGVSGFPEAGVIALSMVLSSASLPAELLPLLLPVDWLVARMRSATNVVSDMAVSLSIAPPRPSA